MQLAIDLRLSLTPTARSAVLHLVRDASTEISIGGIVARTMAKTVASSTAIVPLVSFSQLP